MKERYFFVIFIVLSSLLFGCTPKKWYEITDSHGNSFLGTWSKITNVDGENVILFPRGASNTEIRITKENKEVFVRNGIEDVTYGIDKVEVIDDEFIFTIIDREEKIRCKILQDSAIWVVPYNPECLCTKYPDKYKHIIEEYMSEEDQLNELINNIEKYALSSLYNDIQKQGFKDVPLVKFNRQIEYFFGISDIMKRSNPYRAYPAKKYCDDSEITEDPYYHSQSNLFFATSPLYMPDKQALIEYESPGPKKDFLVERCFHRNQYIFHESKASLIWLVNNDKEFLIKLLKEFGYDKEFKINQSVLEETFRVCEQRSRDVYYNYLDCNNVLFSKDCNGKLKINHGMLSIVKNLTTDEDGRFLNMLGMYLINIEAESLESNLSHEEKIEIYCLFGSMELEILKNYPRARKRSCAYITSLLVNYNLNYHEVAKEHNYWNIPNFENIEKVVEWEYLIANEGEVKLSFDYTTLK